MTWVIYLWVAAATACFLVPVIIFWGIYWEDADDEGLAKAGGLIALACALWPIGIPTACAFIGATWLKERKQNNG